MLDKAKDLYAQRSSVGYRALAIFAGILVYALMLGYTGYHNVVLMLRGIRGDGVLFAMGGIIALEITAVFLPLALKFWTFDPTHRLTAYLFYGADLLLIFLNTVVNFNTQAGQKLPEWALEYLTWIVPSTPIICGIGWAVLFALDPMAKVRARKVMNELDGQLFYLNARAKYSEEDANYRAMIESQAYRDQLEEGKRVFGIKELPAPASTIREYNPIIGDPDSEQIRLNQEAISPLAGTVTITESRNGRRR